VKIWISRDKAKATCEYITFWLKRPRFINKTFRGGAKNTVCRTWIGDMTEITTIEKSVPDILKIKKGECRCIEITEV
jgi:hypothetical protein